MSTQLKIVTTYVGQYDSGHADCRIINPTSGAIITELRVDFTADELAEITAISQRAFARHQEFLARSIAIAEPLSLPAPPPASDEAQWTEVSSDDLPGSNDTPF